MQVLNRAFGLKPRLALMLVSACAFASLAGCAVPSDPNNPIHKMAEFAGVATTPRQAETFVVESRDGNKDYLPVGITPPARRLKTRTPEEVKKLEQELDATIRSNEAKARAKP